MVAVPFLIMALMQCPPPADYQAGVSVDGWAVAPADVPAAQPDFLGEVTLDLDVPAANYTQNPVLNQHFPYAELNVGQAVIAPDSDTVTLNGAPLGDAPDCP